MDVSEILKNKKGKLLVEGSAASLLEAFLHPTELNNHYVIMTDHYELSQMQFPFVPSWCGG